jgi:hypothetical protein
MKLSYEAGAGTHTLRYTYLSYIPQLHTSATYLIKLEAGAGTAHTSASTSSPSAHKGAKGSGGSGGSGGRWASHKADVWTVRD